MYAFSNRQFNIELLSNLYVIYFLDAPILTIRYEPDEPLMENRNYTFFCDSSSNPADDKTKK